MAVASNDDCPARTPESLGHTYAPYSPGDDYWDAKGIEVSERPDLECCTQDACCKTRVVGSGT